MQRLMRITMRWVAAGVFVTAGLFAGAQSDGGAAEQQLLVSVNRARQAQGLPALRWNEGLATAARHHAALMADRRAAEHGFPGEPSLAGRVTKAGVRFTSLSENVAQGPGVGEIQGAFLKSPNHRANILDPDMDSIGVGVVERGGQLYAVEDFSKVK